MKILNVQLGILGISLLVMWSCTNDKIANELTDQSNINQEIKLKKIPLNLTMNKEEIDEVKQDIENLHISGTLKKYTYPEMSYCGGGVDGYYKNGELVLIKSVRRGELGFTSKRILLHQSKIIHIKEREYHAVWEKYPEAYVDGKYDDSKMVYTDTTLVVTLGREIEFQKEWVDGRKVIDFDQVILDRLMDCISRMKQELDEKKGFYKKLNG